MHRRARVDKLYALLLVLLIISGAMIFASAALGLIARGQAGMQSVVFSHLVLGVGLGIALLFLCAYADYHLWRRAAPFLYVAALFLTALVFVPHLGAMHGGGRRWISLAGISLQPSEMFKFAGVLLSAAYFSSHRGSVSSIKYGLGAFFGILAPPAILLLLQPDLGTLGVIVAGVGVVYFMSGAKMRHLALALAAGLLALALIASIKPYVRERIMTFMNPGGGQQTQGYQITQSLIAIGSGGITGRGIGQGIQKFTYLPEPMGDSIFAVAGEELGFVGSSVIIILFLLLALRGFYIASRAPDLFGALFASGLSATLVVEAFVNIAAMLGVLPLTGIPLTFVSQGGSAILVSLASAGVLLNISKFASKSAKM